MRFDSTNAYTLLMALGFNKSMFSFAVGAGVTFDHGIQMAKRNIPIEYAIKLHEIGGVSLDDFYLREIPVEDFSEAVRKIRSKYKTTSSARINVS